MLQSKNPKYDLEERTFNFAQNVHTYINDLPKSITNNENTKQLARSSGSVAANYIEANEALSKKDFVMRIKICRKEAKESGLWLKLASPHETQREKRIYLIGESIEITKILGSILEKSK